MGASKGELQRIAALEKTSCGEYVRGRALGSEACFSPIRVEPSPVSIVPSDPGLRIADGSYFEGEVGFVREDGPRGGPGACVGSRIGPIALKRPNPGVGRLRLGKPVRSGPSLLRRSGASSSARQPFAQSSVCVSAEVSSGRLGTEALGPVWEE